MSGIENSFEVTSVVAKTGQDNDGQPGIRSIEDIMEIIKDVGGRPSMEDADKKKRLTVTIPPDMYEFLNTVPNKSHFVTAAIEFYRRFQMEAEHFSLKDKSGFF